MKKSILLRIFCFIMICCFSFVFISCGDAEPGEEEEGSPLSGHSAEMADLYGVKVLYRPLSYDYDVGSGAEPGQKNDYYGVYAFQILNYLYHIYGIPEETYGTIKDIFKIQNAPSTGWNDKNFSEGEQDTRTLTFDYNNIPYLYDSIRYKVDTKGNVIGQIKNDEIVTAEDFEGYEIVGADLNTSWKWSFQYDNSTYPSFVYSYNTGVQVNNHLYSKDFNILKNYEGYTKNQYNKIYLSETLNATDTEHYSDFVKTLEYVIYSYALDLEPEVVIVNTRGNGSDPYTIEINNTDVDQKLQERKDLFKKAGAFVGLSTNQINKIANWIKVNVIGIGSNITNDTFTYYDKMYEILNGDGSLIGYQPAEDANVSSYDLGRSYDKAVDEIVKYVCKYASIGTEGGGDLTVENRFLASEVIEYAGAKFFATSDKFFPKYNPAAPSSNTIRPLEYQSVVLMPRSERYLQGLTIAIKYDADLDGTDPDEGFNTEKYIDIKVELNYYSRQTKKLYKLASDQTRVYDGSFVFGTGPHMEDGKYSNVPANHGLLELSGFDKNSELAADGLLYNDYIKLGKYDTSLLPTDLADRNYLIAPFTTKNPLLLLGTTDVRKYYKLLEPTADEGLEENQTYISGRFNEEMVDGKCDYVEIVYKAIKDKNNLTKNYNFYTGIITAVFSSQIH